MRTLLTTFAINTGNLISLYLHKSNLNDAIVLADFFHDDRFYAMTQVSIGLYSQYVKVMLQGNKFVFQIMPHFLDVWEQHLITIWLEI